MEDKTAPAGGNETDDSTVSEKFGRKLKESYDYIWKERDEFIKWLAVFAVWAMYFSIGLLVDNRKAEHAYFTPLVTGAFELSVLGFFLSLTASVFYKWRWPVKYLFDELELEELERGWQDEESGELGAPGRAFVGTPAYEKIKKRIKRSVRITGLIYQAALFFFAAAFLPLFFALVLFIHPGLLR